jgi:polar amino acid transport system ATP-binding protein
MKLDDQLILRLDGVRKYLGGRWVLNGVSLDVRKGSVTCILGPSGTGKTTLLKCMNLLQPIDAGTIWLDGHAIVRAHVVKKAVSWAERALQRMFYGPVPLFESVRDITSTAEAIRAHIGLVFQEFNLWPRMTVLENLIEGPIVVRRMRRAEAVAKAKETLASLGLDGLHNRYPLSLSGGQRQRVAIARTLMMDSEMLLLDEITSALDPELVAGVLQVLRELSRSGRTLVIVTHHVAFAREVADWIVMMDNGLIVEEGSPAQVLDDPKEQRTKAFLSCLASIA